jgi:hypothetical protein
MKSGREILQNARGRGSEGAKAVRLDPSHPPCGGGELILPGTGRWQPGGLTEGALGKHGACGQPPPPPYGRSRCALHTFGSPASGEDQPGLSGSTRSTRRITPHAGPLAAEAAEVLAEEVGVAAGEHGCERCSCWDVTILSSSKGQNRFLYARGGAVGKMVSGLARAVDNRQ